MNSLERLVNAADTLKGSDLSWAYDVLDNLEKHPDEISDFDKDPHEYIKKLGHEIPDGFHVHFIDKDGSYTPRENNFLPSNNGSRLEARIDKKHIALAVCIVCEGSCNGVV